MDTQENYFIAANAVVFRKIKDYCRYQPRTHQQVRQKLYGWKLRKEVVEAMLAVLIETGQVSESRFSAAYAHDRFRIHQWGKNKVRNELQKRQISPYCIGQALSEVDNDQYAATLRQLAEKKWLLLQGSGRPTAILFRKTAEFLIRKGYESTAVWNLVRTLQKPKMASDDS